MVEPIAHHLIRYLANLCFAGAKTSKSAGAKASNTIAQPALDFGRKESVENYPFEKPHRFPGPAEFWQPLIHPADGVFARHSSREAALGSFLRNSNWFLGSRFCRSRCWFWLG